MEADANSFSAERSSPGHDRGEGSLEPKMHQEAGFQLATPPFVPFVSDRGAGFSLIRAYICERDIHKWSYLYLVCIMRAATSIFAPPPT